MKKNIIMGLIASSMMIGSMTDQVQGMIGKLKKFKILSSVYRNFGKKLNLRTNIIAGIYNLSIA